MLHTKLTHLSNHFSILNLMLSLWVSSIENQWFWHLLFIMFDTFTNNFIDIAYSLLISNLSKLSKYFILAEGFLLNIICVLCKVELW